MAALKLLEKKKHKKTKQQFHIELAP